jgi:hypothetical protein
MKKLTRYNLGEIYRVYSSDRHSVVCTDSDVAKLEASHAELLEAATNALWWLNGGNKISPKASDCIARLRAAIAKAKGEQQ